MPLIAFARKLLRAGIALACAVAPPVAAATKAKPALESAIDGYLQSVVPTNNFAGVVAIAKGDRIVFQKGYGLANQEQNVRHRPDTVFHVASLSKPFTAAAIMLLVERGAIDLRAPLTQILPDYPNGEKITVHHLLTHTSGIPNINNFDEYEALQFKSHKPEELVDIFKNRPLTFEPGARYGYSNSNYNLLALIIERVTGIPFGAFLDREILRPQGLLHSAHHGDMTTIVPGLAQGYAPEGMTGLARARYIDWSVKTGNGSMYSNAPDLIRFFRAVHAGKVLKPTSLTASFTPHTPNVGYGWFLTKANGREIHHFNGRSPGWAAQVDYYVKDEVTVAVLSNVYSSVTTPIARAVGALYFGERHQPLPKLDRKLTQAEIKPLLGRYRFGPDYPVPNAILSIVERNGVLFSEMEGQPPAALIPLGGNRFIFRPYWVEGEFVVDGSGPVNEFRVPPFLGTRIP